MIESKFPFRGQGYDFIFLGAGCASLSLVMRMIKSGKFADKKILLIDKEPKTKNDRTWCFWETTPGFFEPIVYRQWEKIAVLNNDVSLSLEIAPYRYKMIRGIDFYDYCFREIAKHNNIEIAYGTVTDVEYEKDDLVLTIDNTKHRLFGAGTEVFSSLYKPGEPDKKTIRLLQHFKGWLIETNKQVFDPCQATIMDFRVDQAKGTTFCYVLPLSPVSALVEYTLFSPGLLSQEDYDKGLKNYIQSFLQIEDYTIKDTEFGSIPMTNERFDGSAWMLGTAGGQTKASSGYTFQFIQKKSDQLLDYLIRKKNLNYFPSVPKRFRFYDNTLLHILYHNKYPGNKIFTRLFKKNKPQSVLKFLDNESTLSEELKIISTLPTLPFLKASINQL